MAAGDFELALRGLLGEGAPLSKASIRRLRAVWSSEFEMWAKRSLADREVVYVWADGIYVKASLERDKAALLVVMGAMRDRTKEVLAVTSGYRESTDSWAEVFRGLKARGLAAPKLLMADGNAAIWGAARTVWPEAGERRQHERLCGDATRTYWRRLRMANFIGLDLAWTSHKETGICWFEGETPTDLICTRIGADVRSVESLADEVAAVEGSAIVARRARPLYGRTVGRERDCAPLRTIQGVPSSSALRCEARTNGRHLPR